MATAIRPACSSSRNSAPIAELIWFREAARFSHADRLRALPESARLYHSFGTTSVFEGHGVASEVLRVYREAHRDGTLTMRSTLALSANWTAAGDAPLGPFVEAWAGWLGEPGLGDDWLKMSGLYVHIGRTPPTTRAPRRRPTPAGPASTPATACRASRSRSCCCIARKTTSVAVCIAGHGRARHARPLRGGRPADPAQGPALGDQPYQRDRRRATSSGSRAWGWC